MYTVIPRATTKNNLPKDMVKIPIKNLKWNSKKIKLSKRRQERANSGIKNRGNKQKANNKWKTYI